MQPHFEHQHTIKIISVYIFALRGMSAPRHLCACVSFSDRVFDGEQ